MTQTHINITFMSRSDIVNTGNGYSPIISIENETAVKGAAWNEDDFLKELACKNTVGQVAHENGNVVGFMLYTMENKKIHLIHMAVSKAHQRKGIGTVMVEKLKKQLAPGRRECITVAVRETALPAHLFLKTNEFIAFKVLRNSWIDTGEDSYLFKYEIPNSLPEED